MVLSRRNLMALLTKLNGYPKGSACTLGVGATNPKVWVKAEEDHVHYQDHSPTPINDETEAAMGKQEA